MIAFVIVFLWLRPASAEVSVPEKKEPLSQIDQQELRSVAEKLKAAILKEDIEGILRHIGRDGLRCTDTKYSYQEVRKDLHDKNSHLYLSLFDTARFFRLCGSLYPSEYPAISEKEFFSKAENETIEISEAENDWAK